jgi:hypothetical protein
MMYQVRVHGSTAGAMPAVEGATDRGSSSTMSNACREAAWQSRKLCPSSRILPGPQCHLASPSGPSLLPKHLTLRPIQPSSFPSACPWPFRYALPADANCIINRTTPLVSVEITHDPIGPPQGPTGPTANTTHCHKRPLEGGRRGGRQNMDVDKQQHDDAAHPC